MDIKHFLITVLSGVAGTMAMTLVMYLYTFFTQQFTKVIHLLDSLLAGNLDFKNPQKSTLMIGTIAHFGVGILFSFSYFLLWNWGVFQINFKDSILIGVVSGLLAIVVWKGYLSFHNQAPDISQTHFFIALVVAHLVFGIVSVNLFQVITDNPELWFELKERANS